MAEISINIPSYKRAGKVVTLKLVPGATVWVCDSEREAYASAHPGSCVIGFPDAVQGNIARVRNFILDNCDDDVTVLMDDDISQVARWQANRRLRYTEESDLRAAIDRYSLLAADWGAKLWGVQLNSDKQSYREYTPFSTTSFVSASFSCFLRGNTLRYDESLPLKEDYDMLLQQCNLYRVCLRVNNHYIVKEAATNTGGCASMRTLDFEREQLAAFQAKWGSKIVNTTGRGKADHRSTKVQVLDINPVVRVPIPGV